MHVRSLALVALALPGCSRRAPEETSYSFVDASGGARIEMAGVRIECGSDVRFRSQSTHAAGRSTSSITLNGHPFGVRDGVFYIGASTFGPAPEGATIRVAGDGVFVDGERRGDMPVEVGGHD